MLAIGDVAPLAPLSRWGLALSTGLTLCLVAWFKRRQAAGAIGGAMSMPKAWWLAFAVLYWFFVCPLLAADARVPQPQRTVLRVFAANMWLRGVIELYMLYGPKNWKPRYGVGHAIFSLALVIAMVVALPSENTAPWFVTPWASISTVAIGVLNFSLALEAGYAAAFNKIVRGQTTGDDGLWFADAESPRFRLVNRVTAAFNLPLWLWLCVLIAASWGMM